MRKIAAALLLLSLSFAAFSQRSSLKPGFEVTEYIDMLGIIARQVDTPWTKTKIPLDEKYKFDFRSNIYGFDNRWDLWISSDSIVIVDMHATTGSSASWAENFYSVMTPASGKWQITDSKFFIYKLADDPRATVHTGWLSAVALMADDIRLKIDSCIFIGYKDFIITGHSQGGAISYLFTSWLRHLQKDGKLPSDIRIKTYCSAAPKPGNLYYAYDYEIISSDGWAFNVVNPFDWVPETPFSIQSTYDFSPGNPFTNAKKTIKKQRFPINLIMKHVFNRVNRPLTRTVNRFNHYLGKKLYRIAGEDLNIKQPAYDGGLNYSRAGNYIVLETDSVYMSRYGGNNTKTFSHHMLEPYYYLAIQRLNKAALNNK